MIENINIQGNVDLQLFTKDGELKDQRYVKNLVTTAGKAFLARKLIHGAFNEGDGTTVDEPEDVSSIAIGSGTTAAALTDAALETELADVDIRFASTENNIASFITTFEENVGTGTVAEVGLLTNATPTELLVCRTVLDTPFSKSATDYLVVNWKLQIG